VWTAAVPANQACEAVAVAHATGLDFVRAEGFAFAHVVDEGIIQSCAAELLRYRRAIGAERVQIWADVKKKHSSACDHRRCRHRRDRPRG
jgi:predicted TIM-barrel enzyme